VDQERFDQITRTHASGMSRRGVLRALGVGGAGGILVVVRQVARAGERPLDRVQQRTPQRNRKQRKNNQNNNDKDQRPGNDQPGTGQLGTSNPGLLEPSPACEAQCQEQFDGCMEPCAGSLGISEFCFDRCGTQQSACLDQCPNG
jgi:hypothetical protein